MKKITLIFVLLLTGITLGFSQTYNMANGTINAGCSGTFYDFGGSGGNHGSNKDLTETFCAPAGQYLTFTFSQFALGAQDYLYVYDGSSIAAPLIGNFTQTTNPGILCTSTPGGCLTFVFHSNGAGFFTPNGAGWTAAMACSATPVGNAAGDACLSSSPFCTGTTYNFANNTGNPTGLGGGAIFDCLDDTPNPVWYYLQIDNPGNIDIGISQTSNGGTPIDVDFALWGPFSALASGCGALSASNNIDCSYDPAPTEEANITGAQTGEFYILLLTNYNGAAGNITFSQTGGSGSTNCAIICNVTASNSGPVCTGSTFDLSATTLAGATYTWTGPGLPGAGQVGQNLTGLTPPATPGTYTYTVTVASGSNTNCTATTVLTVNQLPQVSAGTASAITCSQTTSLLTGSSSTSGTTLTWNGPGATNAANPFNASTAGTFTVTASANGCSSTATIAVASNTTPPVPSYTTPDGTALTCTLQSLSLNGSATPANATLVWSGSAGNPITVSAPGTYTLTATDPTNGCTASTNVVITSNGATPNISVASVPNTTIISCRDSAIVLTGSSTTPNITDGWVGPNGGLPGNPITVTTAGQYTYQVTDNSTGCQSSSSVNITLDTLAPAIQITAPNTIITCAQSSLNIVGTSSTSNTTFAWMNQDSISIAGNPISVTDSGTYILTVTNSINGCTSTQSQIITKDLIAPNAGITAPNTALTCVISSVSLFGTSTTSGTTFAWNGPSGASTSNPLSTTAIGTYTLTVTNPINGCTSTQTISVTENTTQPNVSFTTPQGTSLDCNTTTVSLNGASTLSTATLAWSGSSGALPGNPATVGSAGTYTLTATDPANGCASNTNVVITSTGALPDIAYSTSDPAITCAITSVELTGASITPGVTITWAGASGPLTTNPATVTTAGNYTLTVTDPGTGCSSSNTVLIATDTISPNASTFASVSALTCASTSSTLTGTSTTLNAAYSWSGASGAITGNPVAVSSAGTYTLVVTNPSNGCTKTRTITITSNTTAPTVAITSTTTVLNCTTTSISLTASGTPSTVNYLWSGSGSGSNPIFNASSPGNYLITATDPNNGCTGSNAIVITQNTTSPGTNAGSDQTLNCDGTPVTLTGSSPVTGATFSWTGPAQFASTNAITTTTSVGTYTLTVTDPANGCTATDLVSVTPNTNVPNVNAGLNQNIKCNKLTVALTGSSSTPNAVFSWTGPGITTPVTTAVCSTSVVGNYTLTVTNPATGCSSTDQVLVTSTPAPNAVANATPIEGYAPLPVTFSSVGTSGSNNYSWTFGNGLTSTSANPTTTFTEYGTYNVMFVSSISGACKDTAWITINVKEITEVVIPNVFSPNGDNLNDIFLPKTKAVAELTIEIWDRWGKFVTSFDGLKSSWNGSGCNDGTYFYIAKGRGKDKSEIDQTGFILLVK